MRWSQKNVLLFSMFLVFTLMGNMVAHANEVTNPVIFTEEHTYPEIVGNILTDEEFYHQSAKLVPVDNKVYVILSLGWKPSTGYKIEVTNAEIRNDQLTVWANTQRPEGMAGSVMTLPMKVISVPDENQQIKSLVVIYN